MGVLELVVAVGVGCRIDGIEKPLVVAQEVGLCDAELKVENVEVLAFDTTNVAFAKDTGTECPVDIL